MASRTRPFLMTGAALASAAAIVAASPSYLPTNDLAVGAPTPLPLSTAKYALTAITDITIQGINDAYYFGWGGYVGCGAVDADGNCTFTPPDPYYPGVDSIYLGGASGVLYYLVDNALESFVPNFDLDNYYFEIGAPSIPYVGSGELFGTGSPIFQAAQATFYYGLPNVANSIVASVAQLVPTFNIGPVQLGGGILASLFYYGSTPDGSFDYGTPGLSAVLAYISTSISDNLPGAPTAAALSGAVSAATAAVEGAVKNFQGALTGAPADASTTAAKTPKTAAVTEVVKTESVTDGTTTEGTTSSGSSTTTQGAALTAVTAPSGTGTTTPSTDGNTAPAAGTTTPSTGGTTPSTDNSTPTVTKSTGAVAPKPTTSSTKPATKPAKPQNPLTKIGKQISDALGVGKKTKPETSSTSTSGTASNTSSTSSSSASSTDSTK